MLTTYVPYQSSSLTQTESTIFEQVYGVRRRRPTSINLCVQWVPVVDHSSINRWSTSDINNRKFKTETFFETGAIRAQQQSKAVTPPSSDYTDAYLNAFAPKTVSTRRIYRINAPVFANVAPLRTNLSTNSSIRTSQTRFNNINSNQTSPFPTSSSTYSSSFIPDTYPKYEPLSNTQSSVSETQTYNSNDSIPLRNRQSSETTIHTSPQPSSSTISSTYSSKSPPKNVDKPMPSDSLKSYSPSPSTSLSSSAIISTYKPSVSFQSAPLSFSNNIRQSSTNGQTVLPSLKTEKQIERPEILLFQHDEDIRSSCIEKPSPIITPLLESPITRIESKTEPERTSSEDLEIASSKPIEILEKTISKYDSIIDQISEVLASVSPLSSTVSSMSPGKSVLDYEFTSDGSPILQRKQIEPQPSQEATTPIKNMNIQRIKGKHLIRDDSYDKIMTAIEDLDNELTPPPEIEKLTTTVIEEEKEEPVTPSLEDHQIPSSSSEQLKGEVKNLSLDKQTPSSIIEKKEEEKVLQQLLSVTKSEVNESLTSASNTLTCELHPLNETELDEEKFVEVQPKTETPLDNVEFVQQQADLLSNVPIVETTENKMERPNDELRSNKNNGKRVTWSETVVVNNDDESSLSQSLTEESSISEAPIEKERLTLDESTTIVEQQINSFIPTEKVAVDDQVNPLIPIESSTNVIERQIESPSSPSTSSSLSDSVDRETTSSDINQSQSSHDEQIPSSRSSGDTHFVFTTDFSNKNTSTVSEQSSTILDVVSKDSTDLQIEEIESNQTEAPIQLDDVTASETRTSTIENTPLLSLPTIESPINTLTDLISTRFISNDVYHGYLGDHTQFIENPSDIDTENMKISLLASLRQTIATPATPLIETIQSVVSSRRTLTASQPLKNENEVIDHHQNDERLATTMIVDSNEENDEHGTHIDESERTVNAFEEPKTMFESLRDTITEPMPTIGSNLQEDKQTVLSTSSAEPVSEVLTLTEDVKDLKTLQPTPSHDNIGSFVENLGDHSINEIELVPSSLFDSIQEKVSDAITTLAETIQNVEPTDVPSIQTQIAEQQILASLPLDTFREQSIDNPMNASVVLTSPIDIAPSINATSSEMPTLSSVEAQTVESIAPTSIVHDNEQVLTTNAVLSEPIDTGDTEEVTHFNGTPEASDVTISEQKILDETIHLLTSITEKIDENLSLVEQNVTSTNDHPNIEQIISIETIRDQPSDAILLKDEITTTDQTNIQIVPTSSITTEVTSTFETNELASDSNKENEPTFQIIHELINDITQTVLSQLQQHSMETEQEIVIMPDTISFKTEIENASSKDFRESSPTNTELDSLELIDALRGHSIIRPNSSEQIYYPPSRSPSTTTSSQITSSDRYVSYAIHKMGDSSQERLPSFPITADIPIYKTIEDNILPKPNIINNQSILKEDDSTEFDATENLTYSDEILLQKLQTSATNRQKNFDTSSTDDDVDEEIEQHDLTDLERLLDKLTVKNTSSNAHEESYQRYDLATTSSSNDSSSSSKQQPDDIYFIPGYSGLWRPSSNNDNTDLPIDYDADDERKSSTKTRTIVRTLNSSKRPLIFQHPQNQSENLTSGIPLRPDSIDISNRPINEFTFDISESDSYQTCPSSESKQEKEISEQQKISSEESIFLIHEHERGVSLPITMKIDCDDITFRLSTSSPIDTHLYSRIQPDLSSPSTHSEPPLPVNTDTNSQASSPSSNDQQKLPSWLNTINTVTTTTEEGDGPIASRITLLKSAKGPISISECHPQGNYIIIENTSRSKNIDLKNWKIQQENDNGDILIFTFPDHCLLRPNHSLKILTTTNQSEQKPDDLVASSLSSWHTGPNILTLLINPEGKECSTLTKKTIFS